MINAKISSFFAVVQYRSFSKAAEHLYISQSAVSKNLSQLEKDVGFILIDRSNGLVRLTAIGQLFYDFYKEYDEKYQRLINSANRFASNASGNINLGCLDGWDLSHFYPQIQNIFKKNHPNNHIDLQGYNHIRILDALLDNQIDIAVTLADTVTHNPKFTYRAIASAPAVALFSSTHPLSRAENLSLIDFKNEPFYVIAPTHQDVNPMEALTRQICLKAGFDPMIEYMPSSANILLKLQGGIGVQITCQWTCATNIPIYKYITLDRMLDIDAIWIDDANTPSKHVFLNEILNLDLNCEKDRV